MCGRRPALALFEECGGVDWMSWGETGVDGFEFSRWSSEGSRDLGLYEFGGIVCGNPIRSDQWDWFMDGAQSYLNNFHCLDTSRWKVRTCGAMMLSCDQRREGWSLGRDRDVVALVGSWRRA